MFNPDKAHTSPAHTQHYALYITDGCTPIVDRCIVHSSSFGTPGFVLGQSILPWSWP